MTMKNKLYFIIVATLLCPTSLYAQSGSYTNKDGQKVYTTDVVVESAEFAESKSAASGNAGGFAPADRPAPSQAAGDGFMNIPDGLDEELPFN